ncbi:hypothetical protein [Tahibacter caeni]|uniref:hypothetical protein n=1 Tax=Tahibacter caeni TaxID=1453545 RepID=UPI002147298B|nr:hypothetical protein [Tahibacter caeni]
MTFRRSFALALLLPLTAGAADLSTAFPQLAALTLKNEGVTVLYPRERADKAAPPAWLREYEEAGVYASAPLLLTLDGLPPLTLACDSGPSADPSCRLLRDAAKPEEAVFAAPGTQFAFLPDARIVVGGHSDTNYDERRVYQWKNDRFVELAQPLRHVGVNGALKQPVVLRRAPGANAAELGLTLAAGTRVTVLLNDTRRSDDDELNPDYLLLTPEGIVGWAHLPGNPDGTTAVDGLYYRGD